MTEESSAEPPSLATQQEHEEAPAADAMAATESSVAPAVSNTASTSQAADSAQEGEAAASGEDSDAGPAIGTSFETSQPEQHPPTNLPSDVLASQPEDNTDGTSSQTPVIKAEPVEDGSEAPAVGGDPRARKRQQETRKVRFDDSPEAAKVDEGVGIKTEPTSEDSTAMDLSQQESQTEPSQPSSQKQETLDEQKGDAVDEVNAFLETIHQQQRQPAANGKSGEPELDLSTPAGRRSHLLARIKTEPRDAEAWLTLLADAESRLASEDSTWDVEQTRQTYESFFEVYPAAARQWQAYIDLELNLSNFPQVEQLFMRCLRSTPSVSLWKSYLSYTRRVNPLPPPSSGEEEGERGRVRKIIEEAYDFATRHVGMSRDAGEIWSDYLRFVKEREAKTSWLQGQKMDDMRRIFQRVVSIPVANVEQIWREYDQFENGLNRVTAKKFLAERSAAYMTARSALREMRGLVDPLHRPLLPRLPVWAVDDVPPSGEDIARDRSRLDGWKTYLRWEESDPLQLAETDKEALKKRVDVAYAKAMMHMRFYPEVWWMAANWAQKLGSGNDAMGHLRHGLKANPGSFLLTFAIVEAAEARSTTAECAPLFEDLVAHISSRIDTIKEGMEEAFSKIDAAGAEARAQALAARRAGGDADEMEGEEREEERKREEARDAKKAALRSQLTPRIDAYREEASLVFIKWMHFVRRTEGLRPTRSIFAKARKSSHCTWQVYEASALMEYHCSKDVGVATKVFELALKTFGSDEAFVVRYLDFLLSINDENNARALFERTITTFPDSARARPVWERWAKYEYNFGDTASVRKLESRLAEAFPEEDPLDRFVHRCSYMDLEVIGPRDLGLPSALAVGQGATAAERAVSATQAQNAVASNDTAARDAAITAAASAAAAALNKRPAESSPAPVDVKRQRSSEPVTRRGGAQTQLPSHMAPGNSPAPPTGPAQGASLSDAILFFLSILPSTGSFNGPRLPVSDILEAVRQSNIQTAVASVGPAQPRAPLPNMGGPNGRGRGRGRRF